MSRPIYDTPPAGYTGLLEIAARAGYSTAGAINRLDLAGVPACLVRDPAHRAHPPRLFYMEAAALRVLSHRLSTTRHARYLRKIAAAYGLEPQHCAELLAAAAVPCERRTCPTCGKRGLYYPDPARVCNVLTREQLQQANKADA